MEETGQQKRIVVDLGRFKRKDVRRIVKGREGKAFNRLNDAIAELTQQGVIKPEMEPVILVVREKKKRVKASNFFGL